MSFTVSLVSGHTSSKPVVRAVTPSRNDSSGSDSTPVPAGPTVRLGNPFFVAVAPSNGCHSLLHLPAQTKDCLEYKSRGQTNRITEGFRMFFGEIQQMAFLPSPAVPLFIRGTRLLAGRTPSVGFQNLIFVWREINTLRCY